MTKQTDLLSYILASRTHPLSRDLLAWLNASPRFTAFVETYRDKIRKKMRTNREVESALDLRGELELAYRLLGDRRFDVAYEPYAREKGRGADFAVTWRANLVFNMEVARIRTETGEIDLHRKEERIVRILLDKLEQMQPRMANLLVIQVQEAVVRSVDLGRLMQEVKIRAEHLDPAFYYGSRYTGPAGFYKDFVHLSGILLWGESVQGWVNKQARPGLDEKVVRLVSGLLEGDSSTRAGDA